MVEHGDEVHPKELSHLKEVLHEANQSISEMENEADRGLSVSYFVGCADCWRVSDANKAGRGVDGVHNYQCCHCGSDNIFGYNSQNE